MKVGDKGKAPQFVRAPKECARKTFRKRYLPREMHGALRSVGSNSLWKIFYSARV